MNSTSHKTVLDLSDTLAVKLVGAEPDDLPVLSAIHDDLQSLLSHCQDSADQPVVDLSTQAKDLVEQIVLRNVDDAEQALARVCALVDDLQRVLSGEPAGKAEASQAGWTAGATTPAVEHNTSRADAGAAAAPEGDPAIKAEDMPLLTEFVTEARGHLEEAEAQLLNLEKSPEDLEAINAIFRSFHTIKGVAGFLNLRQIGSLAHAAETILDLLRQSKLQFNAGLADAILQSTDLLRALIAEAEESGAAGRPIPPEPRLADAIVRLERCADPRAASEVVGAVSGAKPAVHADADSAASAGRAVAGVEATVKIGTGRLDALINTVGELVIAQAMVSQDISRDTQGNSRLGRNVSHVSKIVRELQDLSMSMRMVPIQGLFQKMTRLVRDLCKKLNKEIDLVLTGGETELDRNVVEVLGDPLMHMVRNAGDHGIETPDERRCAGKSPKGRLELRARHEAGFIVIEIIDDGKGLNRERILKKATAAGIITEGQEIADKDVLKLIFHAGLSTAEKVTDVSGRGVGMDVVKKNIEALRGQVDIASEQGVGSTFTIRLPLTMAVIDGLVARVGSQRYIIPTMSVEQSLRPADGQLSSVQGRGELCLVRGHTLPLIRLHKLFGIAGAEENPAEALIVIVQDNGRRRCLMVDELLGQQQVVIKSLGEGIGTIRGISGGAILGDGNISLILDVHGLMEPASNGDTAANAIPLTGKELS